MIDNNVFKFLNDIRSNNNRVWFNTIARYKLSLEQIKNSIVKLIELMNSHDKIENYKFLGFTEMLDSQKIKLHIKTILGLV